jgi:hypothetical protein
MLAANLGDTVAEFAGIAAALDLFGVVPQISAIVAASAVLILLARANFTRTQYVLLVVGAAVSVAYAISAILARPDWGKAVVSLVVPGITFDKAYLLAVVGRSAPRSRRGVRPSSSRTPPTRVSPERISPVHVSTSRSAHSSPTSWPRSS